MDSFATLKAREEQLLFSTYARFPVAVRSARGCRLYDFDGKEYVDLLSGIAVASLGHCNPELTEIMARQAAKLVHVSNVFYQEEQLDLADWLLRSTGSGDSVQAGQEKGGRFLGKAFFCNSGAEANEAAIKLARRYNQKVRDKNAYEVISLHGCFHGRTLATVAATGQERFQDGFMPMPEGFTQVAPRLEDLKKAITPRTAAVIMEVVQGEAGAYVLPREFLAGVSAVCRENDVLLIVDEVQTGLCRTGKWWGFQHFTELGLRPDIITSAKALANGMPMGAMLARDELAPAFTPGCHASTFGGNALASATAMGVLSIMHRDKLAERAALVGASAMKRLNETRLKYPRHVADVRGLGLLIGVELACPAQDVFNRLIEKGFVMSLCQGKTLRIVPPLIIEESDLFAFAEALEDVLGQIRI